jgi:hypothetical protein
MRVFLSHSAADREVARELADRLEAAGLDVWDAATEVLPGDNAPLKIGQALQSSNAMVVVWSPDAVKSETIQREVQYALGSPKFQGRLVTVVTKPTPGGMPWVLLKLPLIRMKGRRLAEASRRVLDVLKPTAERKVS